MLCHFGILINKILLKQLAVKLICTCSRSIVVLLTWFIHLSFHPFNTGTFQRIKFKVLLLTYRALNGLAPLYLTTLLQKYTPPRSLRSAEHHLLNVPKTRLVSAGDRAFAHAAPVLWNNLPISIRSANSITQFKSSLKTLLFNEAYNL